MSCNSPMSLYVYLWWLSTTWLVQSLPCTIAIGKCRRRLFVVISCRRTRHHVSESLDWSDLEPITALSSALEHIIIRTSNNSSPRWTSLRSLVFERRPVLDDVEWIVRRSNLSRLLLLLLLLLRVKHRPIGRCVSPPTLHRLFRRRYTARILLLLLLLLLLIDHYWVLLHLDYWLHRRPLPLHNQCCLLSL